jgi:DNA (cytosine-5)-methyltransferase 1
MKTLSLFSGCGGLDIGFEAAGFKTSLAVDTLEPATSTFRLNKPRIRVFGPPSESGDIRDLTPKQLKTIANVEPEDLDMMIGGPPCQPFSVAAAQRFLSDDPRFKRVGFDSADRGQLIFDYVRLIKLMRPKAFLIENVPGILTLDGGSGIEQVYIELEKVGYTISDPFVLNAMNYGIPQSRIRAFVIGSLNGKRVNPPAPTHGPTENLLQSRYVSVAQALYGLSDSLPNSEVRDHRPESVERYLRLLPGQREHLGRVDRLDPSRPSKTIIAGGSKGGGRSHLHPYEARTISVRECARLQTFPDDFEFFGSIGRQFTLVGNAVPPLLGEILARAIRREIFGVSSRGPLKLAVPEIDQAKAEQWLLKTSRRRAPQLLYHDLKS